MQQDKSGSQASYQELEVGQSQAEQPLQSDYLSTIARDIRPWLDKIDKVREVIGDDKLMRGKVRIPTIAVIGIQSSGKSSVLESISQIELPKGANCVTRCPLILQLRSLLDGEEEYATIRTENEREEDAVVIKDLSKIHAFIKQKSDDMTVGFQKIVETPIHLHVFKKHYIDLTLVDLPGIYYGDMTEMLIKNIWRRYVEEENTIILYVTPASNDLNTGEAFAIAKKADPEGLRTLTIATKIDTRERETFVEQFNSMQTGLGVVCVRCRTNNEVVTEKISFDELLNRERNALIEDDLQQLPTMAKGTPRLIEQLTRLQREMLLACRPQLRKDLESERQSKKQQLLAMPQAFPTLQDKSYAFLQIIQELQNALRETIHRSLTSAESQCHDKEEWQLRNHIRQLFDEHTTDTSNLMFELFTESFYKNLKEQIMEDQGINLSNFLNSDILKVEIQSRIQDQMDPSSKLVDKVSEQTKDCVCSMIDHFFKQFPKLSDAIQDQARSFVDQSAEETISQITKMLAVESQLTYAKSGLYEKIIQAIEKEEAKQNEDPSKNDPLQALQRPKKTNDFGFGSTESYSSSLSTNDKARAENKKVADENKTKSKVERCASIFKSMVIEREANKASATSGTTQMEVDIQTKMMRKSIFAYWAVFTDRFVDNLHLRIQHNLLFAFEKEFRAQITSKFMPGGNMEFSEETRLWMEESTSSALQRADLMTSLEKIEKCMELIGDMQTTKRRRLF